ncbi:ISL3 family transposase [Kitasatospora kifunensis]
MCPCCETVSSRVHSRYQRRVADWPTGGQTVELDLRVRRFFCDNADCRKGTFAEQVDGLTVRHGRRSVPLQRLLERIAPALGGEAGSRLTRHLQVEANPATLLRMVRRLPLPDVETPKVLGVDEFAFRRGRTYGTILTDMATRRPVDVLPDRTADSFAAWLDQHPGVEKICRDRGGSFAEGAGRALPSIPQVADRWHLLHNLAHAVERTVARHHKSLKQPTTQPADVGQDIDARPKDTTESRRIRERHAEVHELRQRGLTINQISQTLGRDRKTVRRYVQAATAAEMLRARPRWRASVLRPCADHLEQRWRGGCDNAAVLRAEIQALGYTGSRKTIRRFLNSLAESGNLPLPPPEPPPPVRDIVRWIIGRPSRLSEDDHQKIKDVRARCTEIDTAAHQAQAFALILRKREGGRLMEWISQAEACGVKEIISFATGLRKDLAAVTAGLAEHWSSGAVEGHVNRIKMIKRTGYGRAGFSLLRRRILLMS